MLIAHDADDVSLYYVWYQRHLMISSNSGTVRADTSVYHHLRLRHTIPTSLDSLSLSDREVEEKRLVVIDMPRAAESCTLRIQYPDYPVCSRCQQVQYNYIVIDSRAVRGTVLLRYVLRM